jgi:formylglycine-generating enzyme required for sulfatase activity
MIVRGASWRDRPHRAAASYRLDYRRYHKIFNVGFRIIAEQE